MRTGALRSKMAAVAIAIVMAASIIGVPRAAADEGMWTFDNPPLKQLKERYGFTPTKEWLDHIRLSSVRFNDGGSGSWIGAEGLVLTNHHVARGQLQKISTPQKDYAKDGFYARTQAEELKSPDLELNVLMSTEEVTSRVESAVKPGMDEKKALDARKSEIAKIEKESLDATGLRSEVIPLYNGGEYWLYRYKKYTDVRLVFAPEQQIAFYGGDPDNFTYPRYDLDIAIFRVYENGKPVHNDHYLRWNPKGPADGDLVFVSGNPGSTDRLDTVAQLETLRDYAYPMTLKAEKHRLDVLNRYSSLGAEQAREAANLKFGIENAFKAQTGENEGLNSKAIFTKKEKEEQEFRARIDKDPKLKAEYGDAWSQISAAEKKLVANYKTLRFRSISRSFASLPGEALTIVRYVAEVKKPDGERLDGFHDAELESLQFELFSPAPKYPALDEKLLADSLQESLEQLGPNDPFIKAALNGKSPADAAAEIMKGTKLGDAAFRKSLIEGGEQAVAASTDPLVVFARRIDPLLREQRKWLEDNVISIETSAGEKIGKARFAVYGKSAYPDATFTLRLSYGTVKGYPMNGTIAPSRTTIYGLYDRAQSFDNKAPFDLPERYEKGKDRLTLSTPLDFVSTADIIGGNSGSPVIDRNGDFVGIIFDGNIESLVGRFVYDEGANRAVAVDSAVITHALRALYDAGPLADEIEGKMASAVK